MFYVTHTHTDMKLFRTSRCSG